MRANRLLAPWLLVCVCASLADAAPRPRRHARPSVCSSKMTLRALLKRPSSAGGPVVRPGFRIHSGLPYTTTLFQRGSHLGLNDYDAAIQNDAPAAQFDADEDVRPALRPLGVLASSFDRLPSSSVFSPRSPRGPPHFV